MFIMKQLQGKWSNYSYIIGEPNRSSDLLAALGHEIVNISTGSLGLQGLNTVPCELEKLWENETFRPLVGNSKGFLLPCLCWVCSSACYSPWLAFCSLCPGCLSHLHICCHMESWEKSRRKLVMSDTTDMAVCFKQHIIHSDSVCS